MCHNLVKGLKLRLFFQKQVYIAVNYLKMHSCIKKCKSKSLHIKKTTY